MATIQRAGLQRGDLALWDGLTKTSTRPDATGATITGLTVGDFVDVLQVYGSGSARTAATISTAVSKIGTTPKVALLLATGTWTITANLTIPSNFTLFLPAGCVLAPETGITVTLSGTVFTQDASWQGGAGTITASSVIGPYRTPAEIAATVTPVVYQHAELTPDRYVANVVPGTTDMTAGFTAAVSVAKQYTQGAKIPLLDTQYLCTSTVSVDSDRIKIKGRGPRATTVWFTPTAADTLFAFGTGASQQEQAGISDLAILSADSTYTKVAIETSDGSNFTIENVEIGGTVSVSSVNTWSGGTGSIGLRALGRETLLARNLYIVADKPIYLGVNPNVASIHTDHFNFHNLYLIGNVYPLVEVDPGVNITDLSFTGSQPWVKGKNAFKWNGTTTTQSNGLLFENVGTEQYTGTTEFAFDIQANATGVLRNLTLRGIEIEAERHGLKCRNVHRVTVESSTFAGSTGITNLDMTFLSSSRLSLTNAVFNSGSTITLTNGLLVWGAPFGTGVSAISPTAEYFYDQGGTIANQTAVNLMNGARGWQYQGTLANNATLTTPITRAAYTCARVDVSAYSATGPIHCGGAAVWTKDGTMTKIGGSANFVTAAVGVELRCLDGGAGLVIVNVLGQSITLVVDVTFV